jgi:LacI family transcriptional regulator
LVAKEKYRGVVYQGLETAPFSGTGICSSSQACRTWRARASVTAMMPVCGGSVCIDNEELTRYLSRVALSSVAQGTRQMGYQAAKLLHRLFSSRWSNFAA